MDCVTAAISPVSSPAGAGLVDKLASHHPGGERRESAQRVRRKGVGYGEKSEAWLYSEFAVREGFAQCRPDLENAVWDAGA